MTASTRGPTAACAKAGVEARKAAEAAVARRIFFTTLLHCLRPPEDQEDERGRRRNRQKTGRISQSLYDADEPAAPGRSFGIATCPFNERPGTNRIEAPGFPLKVSS